MSENDTETTEPRGEPVTTRQRGTERPKRYAIFNETIQQYVPGTHTERPSRTDASKAVPKGHKASVREV